MKPNFLNLIFIIIGLSALIGSVLYYTANPTVISLLPSFIGIMLILYGIFAKDINDILYVF